MAGCVVWPMVVWPMTAELQTRSGTSSPVRRDRAGIDSIRRHPPRAGSAGKDLLPDEWRERREIGGVSGQSHSEARLDIGLEELRKAGTPQSLDAPQPAGLTFRAGSKPGLSPPSSGFMRTLGLRVTPEAVRSRRDLGLGNPNRSHSRRHIRRVASCLLGGRAGRRVIHRPGSDR
jgi:hypothetical protein